MRGNWRSRISLHYHISYLHTISVRTDSRRHFGATETVHADILRPNSPRYPDRRGQERHLSAALHAAASNFPTRKGPRDGNFECDATAAVPFPVGNDDGTPPERALGDVDGV